MLMLGLRLIARQRNWQRENDTRRKTEPSFSFTFCWIFFFLFFSPIGELCFRVLWSRGLSVISSELQL